MNSSGAGTIILQLKVTDSTDPGRGFALIEQSLLRQSISLPVLRKICYVAVECLQNVTRHADAGELNISLFNDSYIVTTRNPVPLSAVTSLADRLDYIAQLSPAELRSEYLHHLSLPLRENGHAGLGLLGIARRCTSGLKYNFQMVDRQHCYFTFQAAVC